jgi:hypothetical protein
MLQKISTSTLRRRTQLPEKPALVTLSGKYIRFEPLVVERDAQSLFEMSNGRALKLGDRLMNSYDTLDQEYRSHKTGFANNLFNTVLSWSKERNIKTIFLGTTLSFKAAHRFYKKHGFCEIARQDMPSYCQPMDCDEKFYRLDL